MYDHNKNRPKCEMYTPGYGAHEEKAPKKWRNGKVPCTFFIALWGFLVDDSYRDTPQGTQKNPVGYVLEKHLFIAHCYY